MLAGSVVSPSESLLQTLKDVASGASAEVRLSRRTLSTTNLMLNWDLFNSPQSPRPSRPLAYSFNGFIGIEQHRTFSREFWAPATFSSSPSCPRCVCSFPVAYDP